MAQDVAVPTAGSTLKVRLNVLEKYVSLAKQITPLLEAELLEGTKAAVEVLPGEESKQAKSIAARLSVAKRSHTRALTNQTVSPPPAERVASSLVR